MGFWKRFTRAWRRATCQHHTARYSGLRLIWEEGRPVVVASNICVDCGKGLPMPPWHDAQAAFRMLQEARDARPTDKGDTHDQT